MGKTKKELRLFKVLGILYILNFWVFTISDRDNGFVIEAERLNRKVTK